MRRAPLRAHRPRRRPPRRPRRSRRKRPNPRPSPPPCPSLSRPRRPRQPPRATSTCMSAATSTFVTCGRSSSCRRTRRSSPT
ncbi:MAG: hypothetical protein E6I52_07045 [Chloroflexi bacterium]|nr:MAG: hypothetical protein E6I52_07045 [Chloroflexota bacterium]